MSREYVAIPVSCVNLDARHSLLDSSLKICPSFRACLGAMVRYRYQPRMKKLMNVSRHGGDTPWRREDCDIRGLRSSASGVRVEDEYPATHTPVWLDRRETRARSRRRHRTHRHAMLTETLKCNDRLKPGFGRPFVTRGVGDFVCVHEVDAHGLDVAHLPVGGVSDVKGRSGKRLRPKHAWCDPGPWDDSPRTLPVGVRHEEAAGSWQNCRRPSATRMRRSPEPRAIGSPPPIRARLASACRRRNEGPSRTRCRPLRLCPRASRSSSRMP